MLSFARRTFNFEPEREISRLTFSGELSTGLRLVLDQYISNSTPSSIPNSALGIVLQKPANTFKSISTPTSNESSELACFLNSCYLCKKKLKPEEDIYMYMGDQGFCSVECRTKQIAMDEMKEVEDALDRRMKARGSVYVESDLPECPNGGECETCRLLEDLRQRRRRRKLARR